MEKNANSIIKHSFNVNAPPRLTDAQIDRLAVIVAMPDEEIDYSDAPELPDAKWLNVGALPMGKKQLTLRLDDDVIDFFKQTGKRYQTRINAVLRAYVVANRSTANR